MSEAEDKLTKAKTRLVYNRPFFASLALALPMVEAPWLYPPTMATDMRNIYYHPKFVEEHSIQQIEGVICHEVLHVAWLHGTRRENRDPRLWNIACDFAINPTVLDAGMALPPNGLYEDKFRNMTAQAIYAELLKEKDKLEELMKNLPKVLSDGEQGEGDNGKTIHGSVLDPRDVPGNAEGAQGRMTQAEIEKLESEIKIKVQQAYDAAKARGTVPAGIEGLIQAVGKPSINWHDYIQSWVKGHNPDDYTWERPRRTMLANHRVYMPSMTMKGAGIGVLSIDTSGSVSDDELRKYVSEIVGVIEMCKPEKLIIIQHDAVIQKVEEWEGGDDFSSLKVKGRGGTCIAPVFKHLETLDDQIDWMICFTDMGIGDYPRAKDAPPFPVLWAATGPDNAPFGTYIPIKNSFE